jgi:hypothetical protein
MMREPYDVLMRNITVVASLLTAVLLGPLAFAQTNDWDALNTIPPGTKIKVTLKHHHTFGHCFLNEVTHAWLACDYNVIGYQRYSRDEIRAVAIGHHSARTGFLIGGAAGAIMGATNGTTDNAGRVLSVIVLTPVLGGIGAGIGAIIDPVLRGRVVYRTPNSKKNVIQTPRNELDPVEPLLNETRSVPCF